MVKFCPLFSSSKGNSFYIGSETEGILIDAGRSCKQIETALKNIGVAPKTIQNIFITHEHNDHVQGLRVFANKYQPKVYATGGTLGALDDMGILTEKYDAFCLQHTVDLSDFSVSFFRTSHDAAESCGFLVETKAGKKIALATDLGVMTDGVFSAIEGADAILLESNHDVKMLENNPIYPYSLKRRILGEKGHLSNEVSAATAERLLKSGTKQILLGHLSEQNNLPQLAYETTATALLASGAKKEEDFVLRVAKPVWDEGAFTL